MFLGLMALIDPPREAVPGAVGKCKTAGIKVRSCDDAGARRERQEDPSFPLFFICQRRCSRNLFLRRTVAGCSARGLGKFMGWRKQNCGGTICCDRSYGLLSKCRR